MSSHKVYKVYFKRREDPEQKYDEHVALFVRNGSHPEKHEGEIFHVIEDNELTTDKVVCLTFDDRSGILEDHSSFREAVHIGNIPKDKVKSLRKICVNMPGVIAPHNLAKPDCVTWIDNVIYELSKNSLMTFENSFRIPSKKPLNAEGFSFPSKDKGSPSSSKAKGSSSSDKNKGSPSTDKNKGSSSSSKHRKSSSNK